MKTDSEEIDFFENSETKTENDEIEILENSEMKTDIEENDFFEKSDEKTDNEETKNQGQQSGESRACQEELKKHLTEEQQKMRKSSKEGSHAVESTVKQKWENRIMKR